MNKFSTSDGKKKKAAIIGSSVLGAAGIAATVLALTLKSCGVSSKNNVVNVITHAKISGAHASNMALSASDQTSQIEIKSIDLNSKVVTAAVTNAKVTSGKVDKGDVTGAGYNGDDHFDGKIDTNVPAEIHEAIFSGVIQATFEGDISALKNTPSGKISFNLEWKFTAAETQDDQTNPPIFTNFFATKGALISNSVSSSSNHGANTNGSSSSNNGSSSSNNGSNTNGSSSSNNGSNTNGSSSSNNVPTVSPVDKWVYDGVLYNTENEAQAAAKKDQEGKVTKVTKYLFMAKEFNTQADAENAQIAFITKKVADGGAGVEQQSFNGTKPANGVAAPAVSNNVQVYIYNGKAYDTLANAQAAWKKDQDQPEVPGSFEVKSGNNTIKTVTIDAANKDIYVDAASAKADFTGKLSWEFVKTTGTAGVTGHPGRTQTVTGAANATVTINGTSYTWHAAGDLAGGNTPASATETPVATIKGDVEAQVATDSGASASVNIDGAVYTFTDVPKPSDKDPLTFKDMLNRVGNHAVKIDGKDYYNIPAPDKAPALSLVDENQTLLGSNGEETIDAQVVSTGVAGHINPDGFLMHQNYESEKANPTQKASAVFSVITVSGQQKLLQWFKSLDQKIDATNPDFTKLDQWNGQGVDSFSWYWSNFLKGIYSDQDFISKLSALNPANKTPYTLPADLFDMKDHDATKFSNTPGSLGVQMQEFLTNLGGGFLSSMDKDFYTQNAFTNNTAVDGLMIASKEPSKSIFTSLADLNNTLPTAASGYTDYDNKMAASNIKNWAKYWIDSLTMTTDLNTPILTSPAALMAPPLVKNSWKSTPNGVVLNDYVYKPLSDIDTSKSFNGSALWTNEANTARIMQNQIIDSSVKNNQRGTIYATTASLGASTSGITFLALTSVEKWKDYRDERIKNDSYFEKNAKFIDVPTWIINLSAKENKSVDRVAMSDTDLDQLSSAGGIVYNDSSKNKGSSRNGDLKTDQGATLYEPGSTPGDELVWNEKFSIPHDARESYFILNLSREINGKTYYLVGAEKVPFDKSVVGLYDGGSMPAIDLKLLGATAKDTNNFADLSKLTWSAGNGAIKPIDTTALSSKPFYYLQAPFQYVSDKSLLKGSRTWSTTIDTAKKYYKVVDKAKITNGSEYVTTITDGVEGYVAASTQAAVPATDGWYTGTPTASDTPTALTATYYVKKAGANGELTTTEADAEDYVAAVTESRKDQYKLVYAKGVAGEEKDVKTVDLAYANSVKPAEPLVDQTTKNDITIANFKAYTAAVNVDATAAGSNVVARSVQSADAQKVTAQGVAETLAPAVPGTFQGYVVDGKYYDTQDNAKTAYLTANPDKKVTPKDVWTFKDQNGIKEYPTDTEAKAAADTYALTLVTKKTVPGVAVNPSAVVKIAQVTTKAKEIYI